MLSRERANSAQQHYLNSFGCDGANERPPLRSAGRAGRHAQLCHHLLRMRTHQTGSGFWHWVAYDLPASSTELASGKLPAGTVEGNTDFGVPGYYGPCPPVGREHRYTFTVHALDVEKLEVHREHDGSPDGLLHLPAHPWPRRPSR